MSTTDPDEIDAYQTGRAYHQDGATEHEASATAYLQDLGLDPLDGLTYGTQAQRIATAYLKGLHGEPLN